MVMGYHNHNQLEDLGRLIEKHSHGLVAVKGYENQ